MGIQHWSELKEGPVKANLPLTAWEDREFKTPSGKFEFYSDRAEKNGQFPDRSISKRADSNQSLPILAANDTFTAWLKFPILEL